MRHPQPPIENVVVRFTRQSHNQDQVIYRAEVRESPLLLRGGLFQTDIEARLDAFRQLYGNRKMAGRSDDRAPADTDPMTTATVRDLGVQLYELLPDALREALPRLLQHVFDRERNVRLVFEAKAGDHADQLLSMPWEIAYIKQLKTHLGLMQRVSITRRLLDTVRQGSLVVAAPFRIAHVIAQPKQYETISPEIWQAERDAIRQAAGQDDFYTLVAQPGSVQRLQEALTARDHQVVHFLGHGELARDSRHHSYLVFADENGKAQAVAGERLLHLLNTTQRVQLVVLNSCHGASVTAASSIAMQLVYGGVPYVVAMQDVIQQSAAVIFAQTFYGAVQRRATIEEALASTRLKIAAEMQGEIDWSLPTLYTSLGTPQEPPIARTGSRIENWMRQPEGQRQLSGISLGFGGLHLLVAMLLALSGVSPSPPAVAQVVWVIAGMAALPPLLVVAARLLGHVSIPAEPRWSPSARAALLLRMLGAAAMGIALPACYAWQLLLLLVALSFWATLVTAAQILLLAMMFMPAALLSWQVAVGHGVAFISDARVAAPKWDWTETVIIAAGYIMLCGPVAMLWLTPAAITPPRGNLYAGIILTALGYAVHRLAAGRPVQFQ